MGGHLQIRKRQMAYNLEKEEEEEEEYDEGEEEKLRFLDLRFYGCLFSLLFISP
jgi:hypothetical protein